MAGFVLSLVYVLGMAITYAAAGVAAGLLGTMLSSALQNVWVLSGFAAIFVLLALSMFGFYELQLPASVQGRLAATSNRLHGGHFASVFVMGVLSALIVGPCVAAPLAGALLYISQSGDGVLGGAALFAMALGMGVPLLAVGASAGTLLPKAGPWMETVKRFFGIVLLGVAIYLVSPLLPAAATCRLAPCDRVRHIHACADTAAAQCAGCTVFNGIGVIILLAFGPFWISRCQRARHIASVAVSRRCGSGRQAPAFVASTLATTG